MNPSRVDPKHTSGSRRSFLQSAASGLLAAVGVGSASYADGAEPMYDLLIRNGKIVDGSGNPGSRATWGFAATRSAPSAGR
jgi:hypothetical protein